MVTGVTRRRCCLRDWFYWARANGTSVGVGLVRRRLRIYSTTHYGTHLHGLLLILYEHQPLSLSSPLDPLRVACVDLSGRRRYDKSDEHENRVLGRTV